MRIGFTGDIAFDEYTKNHCQDINKIDKRIISFLKKNDYNVIDLESPVTTYDVTEKKSLFHKMHPQSLKFIKKIIKNPIADIANNHMMDYGIKGLEDTIKNLNKEKIEYIGAGLNLEEASKYIILGENVKVGLIAVQYKDYMIATNDNAGTFHDSKIKEIKEKIKELKEKVDWVVIVYHGGEEFLSIPMPYTRNLLKKFLNYGCDVVIAHHPHVIQGYEKIKNKYIFYSLGNFIFDTDYQRAQLNTDKGVLLTLEFYKESFEFERKIIKINREKETIEEFTGNHNFQEINKKNYKKKWQQEILNLSEISKNKKKLRKQRIGEFIDENAKSKIVSFDFFEKQVPDNVSIEFKKSFIKKNKYIKKINRIIKKMLKNKKYRYYAYSRIKNILKK